MKQGLRASLLPAINLAQISEFSLVVIQTGITAGHIKTQTASAASFAFVVLAVLSTFAIGRSDRITRASIRLLKRIGLDQSQQPAARQALYYFNAMAIGEWGDRLVVSLAARPKP